VDRLAALKTIGSAPRDELAWLAAHGTMRRLSPGDVLTAKGAVVEGMFVVLTGRIAITIDHGAGPKKTMEWGEGDVLGVLPYSRIVTPPADTIAQIPSEVLAIHRDRIRDLIAACHAITSSLVHAMVDRARVFTSSGLQDEKMLSLGKLSAGLAHELNNPASAIERSAALLEDRLDEAQDAARALGAARLTDEQLAAVDAVRGACQASRAAGVRSPIEQAEREDAIADWLSDHGSDVRIADALAETDVTLAALDQLAQAVQGSALEAVLKWIAAGSSVRTLAAEIQEAGMRIAGLVAAIKGFTHMDQAVVAEPVDVAFGIGNTVAVLRAKARGKFAAVTVDVEPGLPKVLGFAGELNQIWSNLIDNALDAIQPSGRVEVQARRESVGGQERVVVRVIDNGSGIPAEIKARIFDPFFTTKPVGSGTGLGLDIVHRLVRHNSAVIEVDSRPGRTEFRVNLPLA